MQRFWGTVIEPVLEAVQPKIIVEVGSDQGVNTANLLEFCRQTGATLHVIDPAPGYDVSKWQSEYGDCLVFHEELSLNALPSIEDFDVVLIDGDHNWYTVFNELKTVERLCAERSQDFPLVLLHDIGWPYGRRDLYYDPDSIPEEHRKPYDKKGMLPSVPGLVEEGGMNRHLNNAVREHEPKDGVLTAIEDFLGASQYALDLLELPGVHGLGILTPAPLKSQNPDLARLLSELDFSPLVERYVQGVEKARLELQVRQQEERREYQRQLTEESRELRETRQELRQGRQELRQGRRELRQGRQELEQVRSNLREVRQKLKKAHEELRVERQRLKVADGEIARLVLWIEELGEGILALSSSRQWKTGHALGALRRRALRKPEVPATMDSLQAVLEQFRAWRRERNSRAGGQEQERKEDR